MGQQIQRGAIYYARLSPVIGSEQGGFRPVVIVQNDVGNLHSPTMIVAPITAQMQKHRLPTHVPIKQNVKGIKRDSQILLEQIRTIDKQRLADQIGQLNQATMKAVNQALQVSLSLN
ncbi:toxin-antitoxin system, toxin component, MazF family [Limosilactobacillus coleohominis 101-4-CHN]|uniref:mRNA interferase n=1 Tax=Limosilactobacillus coleohominis 101-4-CHN TaxID=575594 RepID=C7XXD4_9LACO|nr:type II toxin-antitoxin system PemK/MazF family toxin [Limosilactobacillus coleohominis]EEU29954.1 toxin-antitoxin system, toxin component, MazF family [Limosilactobacillus coleohominis 101-4-CHN]